MPEDFCGNDKGRYFLTSGREATNTIIADHSIAPVDMLSSGFEVGIIISSEGFAVRKLINMLLNPRFTA